MILFKLLIFLLFNKYARLVQNKYKQIRVIGNILRIDTELKLRGLIFSEEIGKCDIICTRMHFY